MKRSCESVLDRILRAAYLTRLALGAECGQKRSVNATAPFTQKQSVSEPSDDEPIRKSAAIFSSYANGANGMQLGDSRERGSGAQLLGPINLSI